MVAWKVSVQVHSMILHLYIECPREPTFDQIDRIWRSSNNAAPLRRHGVSPCIESIESIVVHKVR